MTAAESSRKTGATLPVVGFAQFSATLPAVGLKLDKVCRSYRKKRRDASFVREQAPAAALDGVVGTGVTTVVCPGPSSTSVFGLTVTVTPSPPSDAGFGEPATVSVQIPFSQVSCLPTPMYVGEAMLSANRLVRRESQQRIFNVK
ncbi:MAG: hypothetical protein RIC55_34645 [Pirellulaceae bacterium]